MKKDRCIAIVLAAGKGKRMGSETQKQYLLLKGKPMIYYSLDTFQKCELIYEIILVAGAGDEEYCQREIVEKYRFSKVVSVIPGGKMCIRDRDFTVDVLSWYGGRGRCSENCRRRLF